MEVPGGRKDPLGLPTALTFRYLDEKFFHINI
jgi:hypothetical protein